MDADGSFPAATIQTGLPFTVVNGGPDSSGFHQAPSGLSPSGGNRPDIVKPGLCRSITEIPTRRLTSLGSHQRSRAGTGVRGAINTTIADLNSANFGRITQTLGSAVSTSVGTTGRAVGGPRLIQFSIRLQF